MEAYLFSKDHVWIKKEDRTVKLGLSDYAQKKLGAIVFINLPEAGEHLSIGECLGDVESIKTVSDIISPADGEVLRINEEVQEAPDGINSNPYGSWLLEVRAEKLADDLMEETAYAAYLEQL